MSKNLLGLRQIPIDIRNYYNLNNPSRTDFYLEYWKRNSEVPWSLLAHLVSRNAGFQMSDLRRFKDINALIPIITKSIPAGGTAESIIRSLASLHFLALWAYLETANFLIFRDVCPQLTAYEYAKSIVRISTDNRNEKINFANRIFDILNDNMLDGRQNLDPEFTVDPLAVQKWKEFFLASFEGNWQPSEQTKQQHTFLLIANEQNQIEERLVNDPENRYLGPLALGSDLILNLTGKLGWTKLCFPVAKSDQDTTPQHLLIYTVGGTDNKGFKDLDTRIDTGRDLYLGLLSENQQKRRKNIQAWALANPIHHGTRFDYNPHSYDVSDDAIIPGGKKYSPPLVYFKNQSPAWPLAPGERIKHLHAKPKILDAWSTIRASKINYWLSPLSSPKKPLEESNLSDLSEITY